MRLRSRGLPTADLGVRHVFTFPFNPDNSALQREKVLFGHREHAHEPQTKAIKQYMVSSRTKVLVRFQMIFWVGGLSA